MTMVNIVWWLLYTCAAVWMQWLIPGVDFLLPGYIVAMQEDNIPQFAWVGLFYMILQEGMGTMAFGGVFIWYLLIMLLFICGHWLFEVQSFLFLFLLSATVSAAHYCIIVMMAQLQGMVIQTQALMDACVYQTLLTPFLWWLAYYSRRGIRYESAA